MIGWRAHTRIGEISRLDGVPPNLEHSPGSVARAPGEKVYMRVSKTSDSISVVIEDGGPSVPRFTLDRSGELVPIRRAP